MIGRLSLLWKILLSTSVAATALFAITGWFVQRLTVTALSENLQSQIETGFRSYQAVWQARTETLRSVSLVLSGMPDVRAAFGTRDRATIRDTAQDVWAKVSSTAALFLVCEPRGSVVASLGGGSDVLGDDIPAVRDSMPHFPSQVSGFSLQAGRLFELVITPVYIDAGRDPGLLDVLVAGFPVGGEVAAELRNRTGSDFIFLGHGDPVASTLNAAATAALAGSYRRLPGVQQLAAGGREFAVLGAPLVDIQGQAVGDLLIVRPFDSVERSVSTLQGRLLFVWAGVIVFTTGMSYLLARRILQPIAELDRAAARIARQDFATRVPEGGDDELGRLARTFNGMCRSIQEARSDLIRQERIATIGRLATSIVHDLRNPLASVYGGAEMLMDGELKDTQRDRIVSAIYRASRNIKEMLQELTDVSRGRVHPSEICSLAEVAHAAVESQTAFAEGNRVSIELNVDPSIELPLERARIERTFQNLLDNAIQAMPDGGRVRIDAEREAHAVAVHVRDNGPGISPELREGLFQPFHTARRNGLGLGLALSRQTVLDHGGDLWAAEPVPGEKGAHFIVRLPLKEA